MKFLFSISVLFFLACNEPTQEPVESYPEQVNLKPEPKPLDNAFRITSHEKPHFEEKDKMIRTYDIKYRGDKKRISVYGEYWEKNSFKKYIPVFSMDLNPETDCDLQISFILFTTENKNGNNVLHFSGAVTSENGTAHSKTYQIETPKTIGIFKKFIGGDEPNTYRTRAENNEFMIWGYGTGTEFSFQAPNWMDLNKQNPNTADISFLGIIKFD